VRLAFADVAVVLADEGDEVGVYAVNDLSCTQYLTLETGSFLASGPAQIAGSEEIEVLPFTSLRVKGLSRDPQRICYAVLRDPQGRVVSQNRLLLKPFSEWPFVPPAIQVDQLEREDGQYARYTSKDWVWSVVLDPTGEEPALDDVFDLLPGIPYELKLKAGQPVLPVAFSGTQIVLD
jgi:beta-mannosidase